MTRFPSIMLAAGLATALAACGPTPQPSAPAAQPPRPAQTSPSTIREPSPQHAPAARAETPAPVPPTSGSEPDATGEVQRDCLLVVDGVTHVSGRCWVSTMGDGGYTLNTWSHGKPTRSHFAVVAVNGAEGADASWNQEPDDSHAWDKLGTVTLTDGCWTNDRVRICAK